MLHIIDTGLRKLYVLCGYLAALCLAMICPMVIANIAGRWIGVFVPGTNEIGGYLMASAGTLGLAYTFGLNGHVRVSILVDRLKPSARRAVEIISLVIAFGLMAFLAKNLIDMVLLSYEYKDRSMGTDNVLIWIPQVPMTLGIVVFSVSIIHAVLLGVFASRDVFPERESL
ncbi:MAG: TRAP transporter small permease [Albidovulum sp.]|nr:TRAP transporter small permease [Albidovulum sp.]